MKRNFSEGLQRCRLWLLRPAVLGIASILLGVFFIVIPSPALDVLLAVLGILFFLLSALNFIFSLKDGSLEAGTVPLITQLLPLAFGICLFVFRSSLSLALAVAVGLYLALLALLRIISFYRSERISKRNATVFAILLCSILMIVGILLAVYPSLSAISSGILLIIKGAELLSRKEREKKHDIKNNRDIESTDFRDVS